jgi:Na+/melibiose symporter-like transporter
MKLSYKKTVLVGLAFLLICAFWQAYDTLVPKILTDKFGLSQTASGAVMALDNVVALFLLPLFGTLSDRCRSRLGRRTPYILIGTLLAVVLLLPFGYADAMQAKNLEAVSETGEASLSVLWDANVEIRDPESGKDLPLQSLFESKDDFTSIPLYDEQRDVHRDHTDYVVPARQAYAKAVTAEHPFALVLFMVSLMLLLVSMSLFRSPAVALMPDVTPKPLRSKGNAVINLMGAVGGILILGLGILFGTGKPERALMSYSLFFLSVGALMLAALAVFLAFVRERRLVDEMHRDADAAGASEEETVETAHAQLPRAHRISMLLILASVVLWYMGYNAVSSKY